jgi:serine/threonine protein phosphatase PrpC
LKFSTVACSKLGLREIQQDRYCYFQVDEKLVLVITDGNGGKGGGYLAEETTKTVTSESCFVLSQNKDNGDMTEEQIEALGAKALNKATVRAKSIKDLHEDWSKAGTTVTLIIATSNYVGCFWIGDSPAFLYQEGEGLIKLTDPVHTLAEVLIKDGGSREILEKQPSLNSILTECVGQDSPKLDSKVLKITKPSIIVAGSDGVLDYFSEAELTSILEVGLSNPSDLQALTDDLVQKSLDKGSDDNVTVVASLILPKGINKEQCLSSITRRITKLCN